MQKKILRIAYISALFIAQPSLAAYETQCGKDPATAQKKMTHILRSLACSQAKSIGDCEKAAGLAPAAVAVAGTAGATAMVKAAQKFRPSNIAGCKFGYAPYTPQIPFLNLFRSEPAHANLKSCQLMQVETNLTSSTRQALMEADGQIARQTAEIAKQTKTIEALSEATSNAEKAARELKAAEAAYYATDIQMKDLADSIEKARIDIKNNTAAMEAMDPNSSKYKYMKQETDALRAKRADLMQKLSARKTVVGMPETHRARLQAASQAKAQAESALKTAEKSMGTLSSQENLLQNQKNRLADLTKAKEGYTKALKPGARTLGSPTATANAVEAVKAVGAISEDHAKNLRHLDFLLDTAERQGILNAQRMATSTAARESARAAMAALGKKAVGRVGLKVIGGVVLAATGPIAMAAEVGIELGLLGAEPTDAHCLDDSMDRYEMRHLTSFTQKNKCKATPVITNVAEFRKILDLPADEQLRYFNNDVFCKWLDNVYNVHAPKMNVTCQANGARYEAPGGKFVQIKTDENGALKQYDSYGSGTENEDFMHSIYFAKNGSPEYLGIFTTHRQYLMEKSFDANAFKNNFQQKYNFNKPSQGAVGLQYEDMKLSFANQMLAIAEIKSCCNPQSPSVEDATCYSRYGIKAGTGSSSSSETATGTGSQNK